jgi:hypothetical protein
MKRYKPMSWVEGALWLAFFIGALAVVIWGLFYAPKPQRVDCAKAHSSFVYFIGNAVLENGYPNAKDAKSFEKSAAKIILGNPVCFPQTLIDQATQSLQTN